MRSGEWLTAARMRAYCLILLGLSVLVFAGWIVASDGLISRDGQPIGTDFSNVYAAGTLTWQGRSAEAYAPALQHAAEKAVFDGREVPFYGWHYPPFFFAIAVLVAAVPYAWGLAIWLVASFAAYLAAIRAILPRQETLLAAAAFPAVFVNVGHGQNGFLTAALLGGALHWLDRRPWLAGVLIGLLAYKPQFGVLIPIALLAGGRWRTIGAAAATVAALVAVSFALLGSGIWHAFADSMNFTQTVVLEQGGTGWEKIQSIFSAVRAWGASVPISLCGAGHVVCRCSPPVSPGCGAAMPPSNSRPRRWRWAACSRRRMCSTTTSWCSRSRSHFSRGTGCATVFAISKSACSPRPGSCRCCRAASPGPPSYPSGYSSSWPSMPSSCGARRSIAQGMRFARSARASVI